MVRACLRQRDRAARHCGGAEIGARFDAVGDDGKGRDLDPSPVGAVDGQFRAADAVDGDAAAFEHFAQLHDFRFARGVGDDGFASGHSRRHDDVRRPRDRDLVEKDVRPFQPLGRFGPDVPGVDGDLRPHLFERFEVQVDRALADGAAAGQGDLAVAEARQQRPQNQDGSPHRLDDVVGCRGLGQAAGVDGDTVAVEFERGAEVI